MKQRDLKILPAHLLIMLAWRNLWRHRRRTLITLSSIAIGFGLAVLFIGLGDGSHNSMIRNAIKLGEGHVTVQPNDYLIAPANHKFITHGKSIANELGKLEIQGQVNPRISLEVLASTANNSVGTALEGVANADDRRFAVLRQDLIQGDGDIFRMERGVLIGEKLAKKLKAKIGSKIVIMAGKQGGDSQSQLARVAGVFQSGLNEIDSYVIVSNLQFARQFLIGEGGAEELEPVTRYAVFLDGPDSVTEWVDLLNTTFGKNNISVLDWQQMMPQLVQFIAIDDAGNYVFLVLILIMVVIGIINTVLMSVLERTKEFGLLRALGVNRTYLLLLVFCETLFLSMLSVFCGWIAGGSIHWWFSHYGIDFSELMSTEMAGTHMDSIIYTELSLDRVIQLTCIILAATLITGIYPAIKAARVTPVEALHT